MKFKILKETLINITNIVQKGLPNKTPLPILNAIKIDCEKDNIIFTSSNSDIYIQVSLSDNITNIEKFGSFAIDGRLLSDIVRKLDANEVVFESNDKNLSISTTTDLFNIRLMDVNEYPNETFLFNKAPIVFTKQAFQSMIRQTVFAAAEGEKQQNTLLTGVSLYNKSKMIYMVATNGLRMAHKSLLMNNEIEPFRVVIPKKSLDELSRIIDVLPDCEIEAYIEENSVIFKFQNIIYRTRLIEGRYPDTESIIPKESLVEIPLNRGEFVKAIEKTAILSEKDKNKRNYVFFELNKDKTITLRAVASEIGEVKADLVPNGKVIGDSLATTFIPKYLLDALRSLVSNDIILSFTTGNKSFTITGLQDDNLIHLIMPVIFK